MYRNKQTGILGIIITVVIIILLIALTNVDVKNLSYIESLGNSIVAPIQNGLVHLKNRVQGNSAFFADLDNLKAENAELKKRNSELEQKVRELESIKAENTTMKEYMHLSEKYNNYSTVPAYVINRDVSNYSSAIVINVGTDDGVKENMTVIADKGLVGHVVSVTNNTAKVQVIVDPASTVSATISVSNETIVCKGTISDNKILRATYIPTGAELIQGDSIVTSGMGGIFPKGIHIGTIKEIITTRNTMDRYAVIEPAVDFSKVDSVLVIKNSI